MRRQVIAAIALIALIALIDSPRAQRSAVADLNKAGWEAIRTGRLQEAADAFAKAMSLEPRDARLMLGAGLSAYLLGRTDDARQLLVGALQRQPSITEASVLLGQLLYQSGDVEGAVQVYEQALTYAPHEALLTSKLATWKREAELQGRFAQRLGTHFTVLFEGPREEALAGRAIDVLEAAYWRIGTSLGAYPNDIVTVVLYTNEQFRDITSAPDWAGAKFDGRIRLPMRGALQNPRELERVLSHEFTHALVHSLAPRGVPQWLNEGLAVAFESGANPDARTLFAPTADPNGNGSRPIPLARLEKSFEGFSSDEARLAYAESAAAVRALIDVAGMGSVVNVLSNLGSGMNFDDAFERGALVSYTEFQNTWYRSAR